MKTKMLILIGIAICAVLLASPVLASAGYSKIYGNANEDDTLDMRDVMYIKLLIFGKKPATTFADANYDGKISMLDIGQTKLIILGNEKKLTLVDQADRTVTIYRPVERVVTTITGILSLVVALRAADKVVGVSDYTGRRPDLFPAVLSYPPLKDLPVVGAYREPNMEAILEPKPDVVFARATYGAVADSIQEQTGIPVIAVDGFSDAEALRLVGKVLRKEDRAEELISYMETALDRIRDKIPDEEKPKVYLASWGGGSWIVETTLTYWLPLEWAGGINVAQVLGTKERLIQVGKEQIIIWNPDVIFFRGHTMDAEVILADPDLQHVKAVKEKRVYTSFGPYISSDTEIAETYYMAKILHPDTFQDLDVEEESNRILKEIFGGDDLYNKLDKNRGLNLYRWE